MFTNSQKHKLVHFTFACRRCEQCVCVCVCVCGGGGPKTSAVPPSLARFDREVDFGISLSVVSLTTTTGI